MKFFKTLFNKLKSFAIHFWFSVIIFISTRILIIFLFRLNFPEIFQNSDRGLLNQRLGIFDGDLYRKIVEKG